MRSNVSRTRRSSRLGMSRSSDCSASADSPMRSVARCRLRTLKRIDDQPSDGPQHDARSRRLPRTAQHAQQLERAAPIPLPAKRPRWSPKRQSGTHDQAQSHGGEHLPRRADIFDKQATHSRPPKRASCSQSLSTEQVLPLNLPRAQSGNVFLLTIPLRGAYIVIMPNCPRLFSKHRSATAEQELSILTEIGQILSSTLELRDAFGESDANHFGQTEYAPGDARPAGRVDRPVAHGSGSRADAGRDRARQVCAWAKGSPGTSSPPAGPASSPTCATSPTSSIAPAASTPTAETSQISFICVPIKIEGRTAGALSVDKPFVSPTSSSAATTRFLDIIAAFLAQAIQINRMVMRQKEELLEENAQLRAQVRDRYRFENIIGDSPGHARGLRHRRPGRQQPRDRAAARRDRHRQGDDRQGDPLQLAAARTSRSSASTAAR